MDDDRKHRWDDRDPRAHRDGPGRSRTVSLAGGLLGLLVLTGLAGGSWPLAVTFLNTVFPTQPGIFFVSVLLVTFHGSTAALMWTCWALPMAWHGSVLVRLLLSALLPAAALAGLALTKEMIDTDAFPQMWEELAPVVAVFVAGMIVVGAVQQLWIGWSLCEAGVSEDDLRGSSILQLMELTAGAGLLCAVSAPELQHSRVGPGYLITFLYGLFVGEVVWVRLAALSPQAGFRRRFRYISVGLAFVGWYATTSGIFYLERGYWGALDWRVLLISVLATTLFMVFSSLPLAWLRRLGWRFLRRGQTSRVRDS